MLEFDSIILKMILDGYGLPKQYISNIEDLKNRSNLRLHKYKVPSEVNKDCEIGLTPHTDKNTLTILCQNDVQGFEILTKTNKWIQVDIPQGGCVAIVGDTLKVLSCLHLLIISFRFFYIILNYLTMRKFGWERRAHLLYLTGSPIETSHCYWQWKLRTNIMVIQKKICLRSTR
jgi:hypothetical protein